MKFPDDRRTTPRIRRTYPVTVEVGSRETGTASLAAATLEAAVTENVSARGALVRARDAAHLSVGADVTVVISVPHLAADGGEALLLDLRAAGRVVRVVPPSEHRVFGEDGATYTVLGVEFDGPLAFVAEAPLVLA